MCGAGQAPRGQDVIGSYSPSLRGYGGVVPPREASYSPAIAPNVSPRATYFCRNGNKISNGRTEISEPRITSGYNGWLTPARCSSLAQVVRPTVSGNEAGRPSRP